MHVNTACMSYDHECHLVVNSLFVIIAGRAVTACLCGSNCVYLAIEWPSIKSACIYSRDYHIRYINNLAISLPFAGFTL